MTTQAISVWLVPAEPEREDLKLLIERLAQEYQAPVFDPHITLYNATVPQNLLEETMQALGQAVAQNYAFTLNSPRLGYTEQFFKTLFLEIEPQTELTTLQQAIEKVLNQYGSYEFNPHLSLLYKEMPDEEKAQLANNLIVPQTFRAGEVRIVEPGNPAQDWRTIETWRALEHFALH
jgi:2'-5' RNA ligase